MQKPFIDMLNLLVQHIGRFAYLLLNFHQSTLEKFDSDQKYIQVKEQ